MFDFLVRVRPSGLGPTDHDGNHVFVGIWDHAGHHGLVLDFIGSKNGIFSNKDTKNGGASYDWLIQTRPKF